MDDLDDTQQIGVSMRTAIWMVITVVGAALLAGCPGLDDSMESEVVDDCPQTCPLGTEPVDACPPDTNCVEYPGCEPIDLCAATDSDDNDGDDDDNLDPNGPPADCDEPVECPEGSVAVDDCADEASCVIISMCDVTKVCEEVDDWCAEAPLCDDDRRPVDSCEGLDEDYCTAEMHCSGPVDCLACYDALPDGCPDGAEAVDDDEVCDDEGVVCERVETCEETLECASSCIEEAECPGGTVEVDDCDDAGGTCFELDGCDGSLACMAPEDDCEAAPVCGDDFDPVDIDECTEPDAFDDCDFVAMCGDVAACWPVDDADDGDSGDDSDSDSDSDDNGDD